MESAPSRPFSGAPSKVSSVSSTGSTGMLFLRIKSAARLPVADIISSDPFVTASFINGDQVQHYMTEVVFKNLNPVWEAETTFFVHDMTGNMKLDFLVEDWDGNCAADFLGKQSIEFSQTSNMFSEPIEVALKDKKGHDTPQSIDRGYKTYHHTITHLFRRDTAYGAFKSLIRGDTFPLYRIRMDHIQEIFSDTKFHWNEKYDNAQKIFTSDTVMGVIRTQHKQLYGGTNKESGTLTTGHDFLRLIRYGKIHGAKTFFTYCLLDNVLNFSSTGAAFYQDFTSKHAMHSSCSIEVRYAGEFHVIENNGRHVLMLDNNSGTYAPHQDGLKLVKAAFEANFPGLSVGTCHWADPELKQYKAAVQKQNEELAAMKKKAKGK